jgi:hypothetical protein
MARLEARANAALPPIKAQIDERPIMQFSRCFAFAFLVAAVFPVPVISQQISAAQPTAVPRLVNFSGKATDDRQKPIAGVAGITFSIYKDQHEGAALWIETQNVQSDNAGNFTAQLGATKAGGMPLDLFTSGEARWLGVRINGGQEQPRILLLSVPYALKAADAETVGGLPASAFVLASSVRGQSTSTETSIAPVPTSESVPPPPASNVTTSGGTLNALPLWTTATNVQSSAITQTGSGATAKIGIGTTAPAAVLDVKGSEYVRGALTLPAIANATAIAGKNSQPQDFIASSFSTVTSTAVNQKFQWQAEPVANDTANPSGTLNLLYGMGTATPAETGLKLSNKGIFTFAAGQTFLGTGTIMGVTTATGSGLMGGGTSGNLNVALTNTCASKQALVWNGSSWACAALATATSVGLTAPVSDFTVSGSPITTAGTLGLKWNVAPTSASTPNAIVKRDANGNFSAHEIAVLDDTASGALPAVAIAAKATGIAGYGVVGASNTGVGVEGDGGSYGVIGSSARTGVNGNGSNYGVDGEGTATGSTGVYGSGYGTGSTGVSGNGFDGVKGQGERYGVYGATSGTDANADGVHGETSSATASGVAGVNNAGGDGVYGVGGNGVIGSSGTDGGVGVGAYNSSTGDALFAENQSGGFAAFFLGDVDVDGTLSKAGGAFKIDHPLDPAEKYLYHSFVESPDMMNIYNGNVTTDAQGYAIVTMPDWFEALNRDFRYQLTVIGTFAQAIVATEMANGSFSIKTDKPNVKVSWQVTGVRQDAWANAHRIPVEQAKPEKERGSYLHPELYGAPEEKSIAWARHPETMKRAKEHQPLPAPLRLPPTPAKR